MNLESTRIVSSPGLSFVASKVASKDPGKEVTDACYTVIENVWLGGLMLGWYSVLFTYIHVHVGDI